MLTQVTSAQGSNEPAIEDLDDSAADIAHVCVLPLRSIIAETSSFKMLQQVDEVLRRIASGLNANTRLTPPELLILCHTLTSQNAKFLQEVPKLRSKSSKKNDSIVQLQCEVIANTDHYTTNSFR